MPADAIRFYFDYISPNAYLAWKQLPGLAASKGRAVEPVPVLLAGLLETYRQAGPAEVPPKMRWMWKNVSRKAALLGIELNAPAFHPFNPLLPLRVTTLPLPPVERVKLIDAIFAAVWVRGLHVAEPGVVERIADDAGLDGAALVAGAQLPACKAQLRTNTDQAIADGVFGIPTMTVENELFWGYDDLAFLQRFLDGVDPVPAGSWINRSAQIQPSAVRTRAS